MPWSFYTSDGAPRALVTLPGGIKYTYSTTTTDADPGNGVVRTNNATVGSTTQVFIDNVDAEGTTQTGWYETFDDSTSTVKGHLYIQSSASTALILAITGITSASGYYKLTCAHVSGSRPPDGATVSLLFSATGPAGTAGAAGNFATSQTIDAKTANYTLVTADAGKVITMNSSSALTLTVNGSLDLATGQRVDILQLGTGQVTVSASSATVNATPGLKLRAQYSGASLLCTGTDTYVLAGDLTN